MNILFDFDGTLFDTYPAIVENIYREVKDSRKHLIQKEEIYKLAKVNAKLAMDMLEFDEAQRKNVYDRQFDVTPELTPPFPHLEAILQYADTNVIMTHKSGAAVKEILNYYGWTKYFAEIVSKDNGFPKKPDTAAYTYLHEKYHIDLVIGDRQLDLIPAKALGIATCSFRNYLPEANFYIDDYANFPLIVLGMKYGVKSHAMEKPELSEVWLENFFEKSSNEYQNVMKIVEKSEEKEIAYLHRIGLSEKVKHTGFYPLDGALYALEHGFSGTVIKSILLHNGFPNKVDTYEEDVRNIYYLFETFQTEYVRNRIYQFNKSL